MIQVLRRHGQVYELRSRKARRSKNVHRFPSHGYAYSFLNRFPPDPPNARALRRVYAEAHAPKNSRWLTYQELLDALAWDLVSGTVTLNARPRPHLQPLPASDAPPASPPRPAAARPPVAPAPAPSSEAALDAETQAASLKAAAQKGAPFCEECAKKQAQQKAATT